MVYALSVTKMGTCQRNAQIRNHIRKDLNQTRRKESTGKESDSPTDVIFEPPKWIVMIPEKKKKKMSQSLANQTKKY
jgi:hypothetical protein